MKTFREKLASLVIIPDMGGSTDGKIRLSSGSESWNSVDQIIQLIKEDILEEIQKVDDPFGEEWGAMQYHAAETMRGLITGSLRQKLEEGK